MKPNLPVIEPHTFAPDDFIGGDPALDFVNTVTGRDETPRDWLEDYARLVEWAGKGGLLPERALRGLAREATAEPAAAAGALTRAKALRESLFDLFSALAAGKAPPKPALAALREHWLAAARAHHFELRDGQVVPALDAELGLDAIADLVAWRTVEHVLPAPAGRLRICAGPNCSWLFLDSSKAGRRRWCDMADCGNTAKSRRFQARARARGG